MNKLTSFFIGVILILLLIATTLVLILVSKEGFNLQIPTFLPSGKQEVVFKDLSYKIEASNENGTSPIVYSIQSAAKYDESDPELAKIIENPAKFLHSTQNADGQPQGAFLLTLKLDNPTPRIGGSDYYKTYLENMARITKIDTTVGFKAPVYTFGGNRVEAQSSSTGYILFVIPKTAKLLEFNFGLLDKPAVHILVDFAKHTYQNSSAITTIPSISPAISSAPSNGTEVKKVGERTSSFFIQKINFNSVDGLWYDLRPVIEVGKEYGKTKTLHVGDDAGRACKGISEILVNIDFFNQKVTFKRVINAPPLEGCPI